MNWRTSAYRISAKKTESFGMAWHHLPIRDVSIPDPVFEGAWETQGAALRQKLRDGERIVIHCRGGLGRTGMIAARLLIELGETPDRALQRVRAVRPGAVETLEQEDYALRKVSAFTSPEQEPGNRGHERGKARR